MPSASYATLEIMADVSFLEAIHAFVESFFSKFPSIARREDNVSYTLHLAVSEACTNVMKHAYKDKGSGPGMLRLEMWVTAKRVVIQVTDHGSGFDTEGIVDPDFDGPPREGGNGLFIIKQSMDRLEYHSQPGFTVLRCEKEL